MTVPRFSKMVKNIGLTLLDPRRRGAAAVAAGGDRDSLPGSSLLADTADNRQRPTAPPPFVVNRGQVEKKDLPPSLPSPAPAVVQGFRVVGDRTNRIVFLNLGDLGLSPGTSSLRLGDQELVPIEGLLSSPASLASTASPTRPHQGFQDAVAKMSETQQRGELDGVVRFLTDIPIKLCRELWYRYRTYFFSMNAVLFSRIFCGCQSFAKNFRQGGRGVCSTQL